MAWDEGEVVVRGQAHVPPQMVDGVERERPVGGQHEETAEAVDEVLLRVREGPELHPTEAEGVVREGEPRAVHAAKVGRLAEDGREAA